MEYLHFAEAFLGYNEGVQKHLQRSQCIGCWRNLWYMGQDWLVQLQLFHNPSSSVKWIMLNSHKEKVQDENVPFPRLGIIPNISESERLGITPNISESDRLGITPNISESASEHGHETIYPEAGIRAWEHTLFKGKWGLQRSGMFCGGRETRFC